MIITLLVVDVGAHTVEIIETGNLVAGAKRMDPETNSRRGAGI